MAGKSDDERLEQLFRDHYAAVLAFARRRATETAADEVAAETFAIAWRRADAIPADPLPWLLGIARRVLATQRRSNERRVRLERRLLETATEPTEDQPTVETQIAEALAHLSESDREAILLVAWEGLTVSQAARALGISAARFSVRLHRARRRLRNQLEQATPPAPLALAPAVPHISASKGARQ